MSLSARILRIIFNNPALVLKIIHPQRMKNTLLLLKKYKGNVKSLVMRAEQLSSQLPQDSPILPSEQIGSLISLYGLPRSSKEKNPPLPDDKQVNKWITELKLLTDRFTENSTTPEVSIIIPVHNQIRFTLACVHSLYANISTDNYEIIISDDNSSDQTSEVFKNYFPRLKYLRNASDNLGFVQNCNNAAQTAHGRHLIFLNNDVLVLRNWLEELIRIFEEHTTVGIVGSKLIYPEGTLQEAGGIVFQDGSGWNYGRFENASLPQFNYLRDVDYCSGASLAISANLWRQLGGFDERFSPAYYEDTDLAFRVREAGYRVVYQPLSEVIHFEGISNGKSDSSGVKKHQLNNKQTFYSKWRQTLQSYGKCNPESLPADRTVKGRVLVIDATTPTPDKDSGSMDAFNYMMILRDLGFHVTFVPSNVIYFGDYTRDLQRKGVECLHLPWINSPREAVKQYAPAADIVMLCRVYVAAPLVGLVKHYAPNALIVFDTVDLHFLRESREAKLLGSSTLMEKAAKTREAELGVIKSVDATILRSAYEMEFLRELVPDAKLYIFPIVRNIPGLSGVPWAQRKDVVFIGGFSHPPNADAVKYFVGEVLPILCHSGFSHRLVIVGSNMPDEIKTLKSDNIIVQGFVKNLSEVFDKCLLSVAPLRYGAGMKGKVVTSLSYGVPCVATEIAAEGSGLVHDENVLVAKNAVDMAALIQKLCSDENLWQKAFQAGVLYCEENFSFSATKKIIKNALAELFSTRQISGRV